MFSSYFVLQGLLCSSLPSLTRAHGPLLNPSAPHFRDPLPSCLTWWFSSLTSHVTSATLLQEGALGQPLNAPSWAWVRQLPPFEWEPWTSASSVTPQRGQQGVASMHSASRTQSPANSCLPWLAGGETEGEKPLSSPEYTCRVPPMAGLTEHHARHIPGQTGPHRLEQLLSASGVWELACANSWEATVKQSGILPASRYLEISPGRSIYTKEIDTRYKPGLYKPGKRGRDKDRGRGLKGTNYSV